MIDRGLLRQLIRDAFNQADLQDLCFGIGVDYEELSGQNKLEKIRELITTCERSGRLPDLIAGCQEMRPHQNWRTVEISSDATTEQGKLELAIAALEAQRVTLGDAIVDTALAPLEAQLLALQTPKLPPQRKQVTILYARQSGFTQMYQTEDLEALRDLINHAWERLVTAVANQGGHINSRSGEQMTALFGADTAQPDDPARAVRAALDMQAALAEMKKEQNIPLSIGIGISTGSVLLEKVGSGSEFSIIGDAVKVASKLEQLAPVNGILMADSTYDHVRGVFDVAPADPVFVKGTATAITCFVVIGIKAFTHNTDRHSVAGITTHMVGRDLELRQLKEAYLVATEEHERQMVTIIAESGLGKSRLLDEFFDWLELRVETVRFFKGEAYSETANRPFGLLRDLLAQSIPGLASANVTQMRNALETRLTTVLFNDTQVVMKAHFIGHLLGFDFSDSPHVQTVVDDPQQLQDRATLYLIEYFEVITRLNPVVIFLENLQWADDSSLDLLNRLALGLSDQRVLIVVTCRPEFLERRSYWGEGYSWHSKLKLRPLSRRNNRRLLGEILQKIKDPPQLLEKNILDRAAGNPLYTIEIVKMLLREGTIIKEEEAWRVRTDQIERLHVPATLVGIIQTKLDSLSVPEKSTLRQAAIVGMTFWNRTIAFLDGQASEGQFQNTNLVLAQLHGRDLISRRESSRFERADEYAFRNAMLHQVAQESVPKRARRVYHAMVAKWLIEQQSDRKDEYAGDIATHLAQSGQAEKALPWFQQAGDQATARYAHAEAIAFYSSALALTPDEEIQTRIELLQKRESAHHIRGDRTAQLEDIIQLETAVASQPESLQARVSNLRARHAEAIGDYPAAISAVQRTLHLVEQNDEPELAAQAYLIWERAVTNQNDYKQGMQYLNQALALCRQAEDLKSEVECLRRLGLVAGFEKDFNLSRSFYEKSLALARQIGDRRGETAALNNLALEANREGNPKKAKAIYKQSLAIARQIGNRRWEAIVLFNLTFEAARRGDHALARTHLEQSLTILRKIGDRHGEGMCLGELGHMAWHQGNYAQARAFYEQALTISQQIGDRAGEANSLYHLGVLAKHEGNFVKARALIEQYLVIAEETDDGWYKVAGMDELGALSWLAGDYATALSCCQKGVTIARNMNEDYLGFSLTSLGRILADMGDYKAATEAYREAQTLFVENHRHNSAKNPLVGLAHVLLAQGNVQAAFEKANEIIDWLETHDTYDFDYPLQVQLLCYRVLKAHAVTDATLKTQAMKLLTQAHTALMAQADYLSDAAKQQQLLENVPCNREIMAAWETEV